jgi:hypothetical protein
MVVTNAESEDATGIEARWHLNRVRNPWPLPSKGLSIVVAGLICACVAFVETDAVQYIPLASRLHLPNIHRECPSKSNTLVSLP